jgi:hypothetical protein
VLRDPEGCMSLWVKGLFLFLAIYLFVVLTLH